MRSQYSRAPLRVSVIYRCERCGQLSTQKFWLYVWLHIAISTVWFVALYNFYKYFLSGISFPLVLLFGMATAALVLVFERLLGRWLNRYDVFNGAES
jgi:hypothetical protein